MKNQQKDQSRDPRKEFPDQKIRNSKNREKALYDFSNVSGHQTQRMTQNNHKPKLR